ncbi:hypothetical protein SAMN05660330_03969 [Desulforhopalus singaporensis]|uniref:HTH IS21-type domain-containing protein n=1 Tax=Desulforhopalus singaporensis TaxID=91360 RepID=A0A1H0VB02_9BACT|nr:hypothetical protein SAMN05660330_03969 [Desulforhopalus singaporensis]
MLVVETIGKIRRLHFAEGLGIKAIIRKRGLSRNPVRKVIRSGATEHTYQRNIHTLFFRIVAAFTLSRTYNREAFSTDSVWL